MTQKHYNQLRQIHQILGTLSISGEKNIVSLATCLEALKEILIEAETEINKEEKIDG